MIPQARRRHRLRRTPPLLHGLIRQRAEAHAPALKDHDLDLGVRVVVDAAPLLAGHAVASAGVGGLVVAGDLHGLLGEQRVEHVFAQGDVVRAGFAAVLDERIVRVGGGKGDLFVVRQVEVVDGEDEDGEVSGREGPVVAEEGDEGGLAGALDAVETDDEGAGRGGAGCLGCLVGFEKGIEELAAVDNIRVDYGEGWEWSGGRILSGHGDTSRRWGTWRDALLKRGDGEWSR